MNCYHCGALLTEQDFCTNCGADVGHYKKIIALSNYYYNEGLEKAQVRDLSGAEMSLRECLKLNKFHIEARNLLGLIYYEVGDVAEALSEWVISKNLMGEKNVADRFMNDLQGNPNQLDNFSQAIKKYNLALAYCDQGSLDLAMIQLKKVLQMNPRYVKAHQLLALLLMREGKLEAAGRELTKAARIDIGNTTTLRYMKELDEAMRHDEDTRGGRKKNNTSSDNGVYRGAEIAGMRSYDVTEAAGTGWRTILYVVLGLLLGIAASVFFILPGRIEKVNEQFNEATRVNGEELEKKNAEYSALESEYNAVLREMRDLESKLSGYEGTDGKLQDAENLINAATLLIQGDHEDEVAQILSDIDEDKMTADSTSETCRNLYNELMNAVGSKISASCMKAASEAFTAGDIDTALKQWEKAFAYDDNNSEALINMADAYRAKGDMEHARETYSRVIETFPETTAAENAAAALEEIQN